MLLIRRKSCTANRVKCVPWLRSSSRWQSSAQKSVMTAHLPCPIFSLSFAIARNFSTMGRTLPAFAVHDFADQQHGIS